VSLVLDSSIALTWIYADEGDEQTEHVLQRVTQSEAWVPAIWRLEVANSLQQGLKRGRIDRDDRDLGLADLSRLRIHVDPETDTHAWSTTLDLSTRFNLTVYDAAYLELAMRRGLPLATLDRALRAAASAAGVTLLGI
jgi:predicted nucleic acid-binding protein